MNPFLNALMLRRTSVDAAHEHEAWRRELTQTLAYYAKRGRVVMTQDGNLAQQVGASAEMHIQRLEDAYLKLWRECGRLRSAIGYVPVEAGDNCCPECDGDYRWCLHGAYDRLEEKFENLRDLSRTEE